MPFGGSGFAGEGPGVDAVRPKRDAVTLRSRGDPRLGMAREWACRLGALPPMCMTHHGPDPTESTEYKGVAGSTAPVASSPPIISWIPTKVSDTGANFANPRRVLGRHSAAKSKPRYGGEPLP